MPDLVSLGFLLVMILAGGLVALIADKLGRTLGKKRLTLFGLRPRHTATMITVIAGMLIPFITVLFVALVSQPVREWLVEGRHALEQLRTRNAEIVVLDNKQSALTEENKKTSADLRQKEELLKRESQTVASLQDQTRNLKSEALHLTSSIRTLDNNVQLLTANLKQTKLSLVSAQSETKVAIASTKRAQNDFLAANTRLSNVKASYFELKKQWDELNQKSYALSSDNDKLTSQNSSLAAQNAKAASDLEMSKQNLERSQEQLDEVNTNLKAANDQLAVLSGTLTSDILTSRNQPPMFSIGDELARVSVPAGSSAEDAKGLLANLMQDAVHQATIRGAGPFSSLITERAALYPLKDAKGHTITPEDQEETILKGITEQKDDIVLVALCKYNTFLGEGVPLDIKAYPNSLVYKRDAPIAETRVNGGLPEEDIRQQIIEFLTKTVKPKALADDMIPISGQEEQLGEVPINQIVDLARNIHALDRRVKVTALADSDTHRGDPLKLHFRVR